MRRLFFTLLIAALTFSFATPVLSAANLPGKINFYPGASLRFEHLTLDDGLSQNAGLVTLQDSRGYLWFGTQDGLNRYDGKSFTIFKTDPDDPATISHNSIIALLETPDGFIWVGTWGGGLSRFDPRTSKFTRYLPEPKDPASLSHVIVTSLAQAPNGKLWVGTLGGLDLLDPVTGKFTHFRNDPTDPASLSSNAISVILPAPDGWLWVGTGAYTVPGAGLNHFDPATGKVERLTPQGQCFSGANISALAFDDSANLWVAFGGYSLPGNGIERLNPTTGKCLHYDFGQGSDAALDANNVIDVLVDRDGQLWATTWGGGLMRMDTKWLGKFSSYRHDTANLNSISNDTLFSLFQDRSGVLWIGSLNTGINKLDLNNLHFRLYERNDANPYGLSSGIIGAFAQTPDGMIWVGTWESGLERFDQTNGTFVHFRHDSANPDSLASDLVMSVHVDGKGLLWVGTLGAGLDHFDPATGKAVHYVNDPVDSASLVDNNVVATLLDAKGRLWVGTMNGLDRFDPQTGNFSHYQNDPANPASLSVNAAVSFMLDGDMLWVGTWGGGLNRLDLADPTSLDPKTARFEVFRHDPQNPHSISEDGVWSMLKARDGAIWFGTQGGLNRFDAADKSFKTYREKDGLRNTTILGILEDDNGYLWLTTNNGLARFDPANEKFTIYEASDGLQGNEFNSNAYFKSASGELFVGGSHGFNVFDPRQIRPNPVSPSVAITGFKIFNTPVEADLSGKAPLKLNYDQNFIAFEFAALDFQAPQKNQYAYKLEGFDKDWVEAGTRNYASYTNLPGGEYTFRVRAANSDGVWNETGVSLPLSVTPPFWQTWQFLLALTFGLAGLSALGFRWRVRAVRQQNVQLQAMLTEQQRVEVELRESEARFRAMFENAGIGIALVGLDRQALAVNDSLVKMSGYSREELMSTNGFDLSYASDRTVGASEFADLLAGKLNSFQVERRYLSKAGQPYWVKQTISAVRGNDDKLLYLVAMVEDIEQQKQGQENLRASEARFRAMFDNASVGMSLMSLDRRVVSMNQVAEKIVGYKFGDLENVDPTELSHPDDREIGLTQFREMVAGTRQGFVMEKRFVRQDGTVIWGRVVYSVVPDKDGKPQYLVGMIEDITEQHEMSQKLEQQEREYRETLEQRVEERTHELADANSRLIGEIEQRKRAEEALAVKAADDAVAAERTRLARDLHDAVTQTLFAASLIAEVLPDLWAVDVDEAQRSTEELRQLTRGALAEMRTLLLELRPAALTQTRLSDLLRQLCDALIGRARLPIKLEVEGDRSLPPEVQVAFYRIAQESLNNVFKYARATQVSVTLYLTPAGVHLDICDNGIGFNMATRKSTSLGHRIMRERAEAIGADLSISSQPGDGVCVDVDWVEKPDMKLSVFKK